MLATLDHFVDVLRDSNLLTREQYNHLSRELAPMFQDSGKLSAHLVKLGWITGYQAARLEGDAWQELFLGDYYIWDRIGVGGMGEVFRARHTITRKEVALKVVLADKELDETALKRFHREARVAAKLNHPNIVGLLETGQDGARHYIAMEFVDGKDLARIVAKEGPLPVHIACDIIRQAAEGLQHAHSQGLVHRDIKPSNILVTQRGKDGLGFAKVLDMGLARTQAVAPGAPPKNNDLNPTPYTALTRDGAVIGTADYMAPEQAVNSSSVDHRADIYSLGCTFYFLLSGKALFEDGTPIEKLLKHQMDEPVNIRQIRPDVPQDVARILHRCLAKKPENRLPSCADIARKLQPWCVPGGPPSDLKDQSSLITRVPAPAPVPATQPAPAAPPYSGGGKGVWIGAGAAVLAIVGAAVVFLAK